MSARPLLHSTTQTAAPGRVSILVVDELPANLLAMRTLVASLGHDVVGVRSGLEALNAASTREFAVIVLEVALPGLDGFETLKRLREHAAARGTPVIFLTAERFDAATVRRAYALGAVDYLQKPVPSALVRGKLSSFIALFQQRREIARQDAALRIKDRQMGILAHDVRAPLTTALEGARQLKAHHDLKVRIVADRIDRSARELEQLTQDLLESARSATAICLRPQPIELSSLVEQLVDDFRATYASTRFSTALTCDLLGVWDPIRIRQALSNLVGNAVKYGEKSVAIETHGAPHAAWIVVESGGQMLSAHQLAQLFGPLSTQLGLDPELGLGIIVAKEIAQAHGGELHAETDRRCTRFIVKLPRDQRQTPRGEAAQ